MIDKPGEPLLDQMAAACEALIEQVEGTDLEAELEAGCDFNGPVAQARAALVRYHATKAAEPDLVEMLHKAEDGDMQQCLANYRAVRRAALTAAKPKEDRDHGGS